MGNYYLRYEILLLIIMEMHLGACQTCRNDIRDLFYNVDFAGPFFDRAVYIVDGLLVSAPMNLKLFDFFVSEQTRLTRPSYYNPTRFNNRLVQSTLDNITVESEDPNFYIQTLDNTYTLYTNTSRLNYFVPFHRYVFYLTASQTFPDRLLPVISKAVVQITLKNDNLDAPHFIPPNPIFYLVETTPAMTEIGAVYATDSDNDGIEYSISHERFSIDPSTGVLRLEKDFISSPWTNPIMISVTATDDGSSCSGNDLCHSKSNSTTIQIIVILENRYSPYFSDNNLCGGEISFTENKTLGSTIASFTVVDNDREDNGRISFSFPSSELQTTVRGLRNTAYNDFNLYPMVQSGSTRTVELKTNKIFDYDEPGTTRVWFLNIIATDHGTPSRQALCSVQINLLDVNDNAPEFLMPSWKTTIYKSSASGRFNSRILRLIAFDADSDRNGEIDYYIGSRSIPYFHIEQKTGMIVLEQDPASFSSSDISRFPIEFQVYAQDRGTLPKFSKNNATVTISYSSSGNLDMPQWVDQNNEELRITISEKFYELYPNRAVFQEGVFNGAISYELNSQIPSILTVSSPFSRSTYLPPFDDLPTVKNGTRLTSGILVTSGLHAEIEERYFLLLRVLVDPPLISSVVINLIDENDQIPTFGIRSFQSSVLENEHGLRILARLRAFDRDIAEKNNLIRYKLNTDLSDNQTIQYFHVELNGTVWTNRIFRKEDNRTMYRLIITAYNEELVWNSSKQAAQDFQFDVQVIGETKNPPKFESQSLSISVSEIVAKETIILNITITDADVNTKLDLGILRGNIRNAFIFTLLSDNSADVKRTQYEAMGQLKVIRPLDYELVSNYTLVLYAFDTRNLETIEVIVKLESENTRAPVFIIPPAFHFYPYQIDENSSPLILRGPSIQATDADLNRPTSFSYEIYDPRRQLNLANVFLNSSGASATIGINSPGLSADLPFGRSEYRFGIRVTDEIVMGVSSYAEASIKLIGVNNKAPIPMVSECIPEGTDPSINIAFTDPDDSTLSYNQSYTIVVISPTNFKARNPTFSREQIRRFQYEGSLNRSVTKHFTVTLNATDSEGVFGVRTFSIIVCDQSNTYPISDGLKSIKIIYVQGYENSLRKANLGSVYVQDLNDWFRAQRTYVIRPDGKNPTFNIIEGNLYTPEILSSRPLEILVNVTKPSIQSSAVSTIQMDVVNIDSEYVRNALTIRIRGEYPETMLSDRFDYFLQSLASLLQIGRSSIITLTIRSVFRYQPPYDPPKTLEEQKAEALTDVVFYVVDRERFEIQQILKDNLNQFQSRFQINVIDISPNPCLGYSCPEDTHCRATRTINPRPNTIDANVTSFVGINILDSADCLALLTGSTICPRGSFSPDSMQTSSSSSLEQAFGENNNPYAEYDGTLFSSLPPTRFSFDFLVSSLPTLALVLLYGRNSAPINDFFWIAVEIVGKNLKFHFHDQSFPMNQTELNIATWYHVECQFIQSTILASINDCQYVWNVSDRTMRNSNLSSVRLYLGGVPMSHSLVAQLYPSLQSINNFTGRIRNVLSNGCYLSMPTTDVTSDRRLSDTMIPWYTWLIIALVLLLLATVLVLSLLTCLRRKQQMRELRALYTDETGDNIIDYIGTAGEEDHSTYNLRVLKKPIFPPSDGNSIPTITRSEYIDPRFYYRSTLGEYIDQKLHENVIPYANDTQLHYLYEGEGSLASNLSSLESPFPTNPKTSLQDNDDIIL